MIYRTSTDSIYKKNKVLYFSLEDFIDKIIIDDNCFICGANPDLKEFNNEHVIPNWILRKHNLHSQKVKLSNDSLINYGQYVIPCCKNCNSELSDYYEKPLSKLLNKSYKEVVSEIKSDNSVFLLLFQWLNLIFLKTHLKDQYYNLSLDRRVNKGMISESYNWSDIHHIYCVARSHYSGAKINENAIGSMYILPAMEILDTFDYLDSTVGKTILIQLNEIALIANLTDAGAGLNLFSKTTNMISSALTHLQLREIVSVLNFINVNLEEKPTFLSDINSISGDYEIRAELPQYFKLLPINERTFSPGEFLHYYVEDLIGDIENRDLILSQIKEGVRSYLLDKNGEFSIVKNPTNKN